MESAGHFNVISIIVWVIYGKKGFDFMKGGLGFPETHPGINVCLHKYLQRKQLIFVLRICLASSMYGVWSMDDCI